MKAWLRRQCAKVRRLRKRNQRGLGQGISLLVPFRPDGAVREEAWEWLSAYYRFHLPGAEVVMGTDDGCDPFSKSMALNHAARHAHGDVFVLLDADCLIDPAVITRCAERIRQARARQHHLWFVPYRRFYRLNEEFSRTLLDEDPRFLFELGDPPPDCELDHWTGVSSGHHWGALIQIMPREAFELVRGMDPRFRSWGSEDVSFMWALDTLFGKHKTSNNPVYHMWHPTHGGKTHVTRHWKGGEAGVNNRLAARYRAALGNRMRMRRLVDEAFDE